MQYGCIATAVVALLALATLQHTNLLKFLFRLKAVAVGVLKSADASKPFFETANPRHHWKEGIGTANPNVLKQQEWHNKLDGKGHELEIKVLVLESQKNRKTSLWNSINAKVQVPRSKYGPCENGKVIHPSA